MNTDVINICFVFNDSDWEYTKKIFPTIFSLLENNKDEKLKVFFICKWVKNEYLNYIEEIFNKYNQDYLLIDDFWEKEYLVDYFKNTNTSSWNYWIFFKLLIPFVLPKNVNKVINFDSDDVIINWSLREMWEIDLWNHFIASVSWYHVSDNYKFNLPNPTFRVWWNIYNLDLFRSINFEKEFKDIIKKYWKKLTTPESDILNILLNDKVLYLDDKFNFIPKNYSIFNSWKTVYHFNDRKFFRFKFIFEVNKDYKKLYYKYYKFSKYKIIRKFNFFRTINSITICNIIIKKISLLLQYLWIREFIVKKIYGN